MPTLERIDRLPLEHTPLPSGMPFLTAAWRNLVMLNFDIDPRVLAPYVPRGVELDLYENRALVSIVAFKFEKARFYGVPAPLCSCIPEVNLRFYVHRNMSGHRRPGVVFIKELAPRRAVSMAMVANHCFHEHYKLLPMRHATSPVDTCSAGKHISGKHYEYAWKHRRHWQGLQATAFDAPCRPDPTSEEAFVVDHWFAYTRQPDGSCVERQVAHAPWTIRPVEYESLQFQCDVAGLFGPQFVDALSRPPSSAFVSTGSPVGVFPGVRVD